MLSPDTTGSDSAAAMLTAEQVSQLRARGLQRLKVTQVCDLLERWVDSPTWHEDVFNWAPRQLLDHCAQACGAEAAAAAQAQAAAQQAAAAPLTAAAAGPAALEPGPAPRLHQPEESMWAGGAAMRQNARRAEPSPR